MKWKGAEMKNTTFQNFKAKVLYSMYKQGLTTKMMAKLFGVSEEYLQELLNGQHRDENAKDIIKDLIQYF